MITKTKLSLYALTAAFALVPAVAQADDPGCDPPSVAIVSPASGATFAGDPAEVPVQVSVMRGVALRSVAVEANGTQVGSEEIDDNGTFEISVELEPGEHTLQAIAQDDCGGSGRSSEVPVTVTAAASDDGAPNGSGDGDGDDGGCAVSRTPNRTVVGLSAFLIAVLGAWRLRRGRSEES